MRIATALRAFFAALFNGETAMRLADCLASPRLSDAPAEAPPEPARPVSPPPKARSDALTLLAALQREARFIDILKEPLGNYSDAQVGAAARNVLRDCQTVIDRMFGLQPLLSNHEGDTLELLAGFDAAQFQLTGRIEGEPPFRGQVVHPGWQASRCEVPAWSGSQQNALIVSPAEVEVR